MIEEVETEETETHQTGLAWMIGEIIVNQTMKLILETIGFVANVEIQTSLSEQSATVAMPQKVEAVVLQNSGKEMTEGLETEEKRRNQEQGIGNVPSVANLTLQSEMSALDAADQRELVDQKRGDIIEN